MAQPYTNRPVDRAAAAVSLAQYPPETVPNELALFSPPGGIHREKPLTRYDLTEAFDICNFRIYNGRLRVRPTLERLGSIIPSAVCAVTRVVDINGTEFLVAATTSGIYKLAGDTWTALTGPVLTGTTVGKYHFASWNDQLVYANGADAIGSVNFNTGAYAALSGAPVARVVTTFAGRIIAGRVAGSPNRVQWCVRNNNGDWSGLGSGYEDLLSTPGGVVDEVMGLWPLNDINCLVIRSKSIWLMQQTGDVFAPFSFSRIVDAMEAVNSHSFVSTPKGIIGLFRDNVYLLTADSGPVPIGTQIRDAIITDPGLSEATACYNPYTHVYSLAIPGTDYSNVWHYHMDVGQWTRDRYPCPIVNCIAAIYQDNLRINQLSGSINALYGPITSLGLGAQRHGFIFTDGIAGHYIVRDALWDNDELFTDQLPDPATDDGILDTITAWLSTPMLIRNPLEKSHIVEAAFEYRNVMGFPIQLQYSLDGGNTWIPGSYGQWDTTYDQIKIKRVYLNKAAERIQLRLYCTNAATLAIYAMYVRFEEVGKLAY